MGVTSRLPISQSTSNTDPGNRPGIRFWPDLRRIVGRCGRATFTLFSAAVAVRLLLYFAPGDPARIMLGERAPESAVEAMRTRLGLDEPLFIQIGRYIQDLLSLNLGESISYRRSSLSLIIEALPNTAFLATVALVISLVIAVPLGVFAAARPGGVRDQAALGVVLVSQSLPAFWVGFMLITLFAVELHWFPTSGAGTWRHVVLPAVSLSLFLLPMLTRSVRSAMIESLGEDYIRTAVAKGASRSRVLFVHAFPNTLIPIVTILALQLGTLLGGAYITETVFAWPGVGRLGVSALENRDYSLALAVVIFSSAMIVVANLLVDLSYRYFDPRLRS